MVEVAASCSRCLLALGLVPALCWRASRLDLLGRGGQGPPLAELPDLFSPLGEVSALRADFRGWRSCRFPGLFSSVVVHGF